MQCVIAGRLLALLGCTVEVAAPPKELNAGEIENHDCGWRLEGDWAGVTRAFLDRGYNVVANSLHISNSASTATAIAETAIRRFGSIDGVVNNAGIYSSKPFRDFTAQDFEALSAANLLGYIVVTQAAVKQMLAQATGGSVTCISSAMVEHPISGVNASLPMVTKGGLEAITRSLAMEFAGQGIRFNSVAPGVVNTRMHALNSKEYLKTLSPMGEISEVEDIVDAVLYLSEARRVTGEVLHVDGGAHNGKW